VPLEVKSGASGRMRSLLQFLKEKEAGTAVRVSGSARVESHEVEGGQILSIPFYLVSQVDALLRRQCG
jgi:hypothetical protein